MTLKLSVASFGAVADGRDNAVAINMASAVGKAQGQPVYLPPGEWGYADIITLDSVQLVGDGDASILYALDPTREAIYLRGIGAGVRKLQLAGVQWAERLSPWECSRVVARQGATDWVMEDLTVISSSAAGLVSEGAHRGRIRHCRVSDTLADAIHLTNASSRILVEHNTVRRAGDDGVACVSYRPEDLMHAQRRRRLGTPRDSDTGLVSHIIARYNTIRDSLGGRCMSVVGGHDILYLSNMLDSAMVACGVYVAQEDSWNTYGAHEVRIAHNSLHNCGKPGADHPAILIFSDGTEANENVTVLRSAVSIDEGVDNRGGVRVYGPCTGTAIDSNLIVCDQPLRIDTEGVTVTPWTDGPVGVQPPTEGDSDAVRR